MPQFSPSYKAPRRKTGPRSPLMFAQVQNVLPHRSPGRGFPAPGQQNQWVTSPTRNSVAESRRGEGDGDIWQEVAAGAGGVRSKRPRGASPRNLAATRRRRRERRVIAGDPGTVAKGTMGRSAAEWSRPPSTGGLASPAAAPFAPCPRPPGQAANPPSHF